MKRIGVTLVVDRWIVKQGDSWLLSCLRRRFHIAVCAGEREGGGDFYRCDMLIYESNIFMDC